MAAFTAIWDTGATDSVISQRVVDTYGSISTGFTTISHVQGKTDDVPTFLINIALPNNVRVTGLPVIHGVVPGADVLIGMDIINNWDGHH